MTATRIPSIVGDTELLGAECGRIQTFLALHASRKSSATSVSRRVAPDISLKEHFRLSGFDTLNIPFQYPFNKGWTPRNWRYRKAQIQGLYSKTLHFSQEVKGRHPNALIFKTILTYVPLALALRGLKTPVIFRFDGAPSTQSSSQMGLSKSLAHRSNAVVCISQFLQSEVETYLTKAMRISFIPNIAPIRTTLLKTTELSGLYQQKKTNQSVNAGNITEQQEPHELEKALIARNDPDIRYWILSEAAHYQELEKVLKAKGTSLSTKTLIKFKGYIHDYISPMKLAHGHIAPSNDGQALESAVQEVNTLGTLSLLTPFGRLPEIRTLGHTSWILGGVRVKAIEEGLQNMINNPKALAEVNILRESAQFNDSDTFRDRFVRVLHTVLKA